MKTVLPARDNPVTPSLTVGWKKWSPYSNRARADRRASSTISAKRRGIRTSRTRFDGGNRRERAIWKVAISGHKSSFILTTRLNQRVQGSLTPPEICFNAATKLGGTA